MFQLKKTQWTVTSASYGSDSLIEICVVVGMDQDTGLVQTLSPEVSFFCRIIRWEAFGQDLFFLH